MSSFSMPTGAFTTAFGGQPLVPGFAEVKPGSFNTDYGDIKTGTSDFQSLINLMRDPEYRRGVMQDTLAFQGEQMKQAGKYKMMFDMPEKITKAFTVPAAVAATGDIAAANALATGALNTANITATAGANIGSLYSGIRPTPVQVGSTNYNLY